MSDLQKIKDVIEACKEVAIISHYHPDGDTIGSQIALALGLEKLGIKTLLFNRDPVPNFYQFLPNWQRITKIEQIELLPKVLIFVDCATLERTGFTIDEIKQKEAITINIDHHISNSRFADLNWVEPTAAATAELIYDLLGLLQVKIDEKIASALYTGISTDTGSFLYENTTATTHQIASDLINRGADVNLLRTNYYENVSRGKLNLLTFGLNNLSFIENEQLVWIALDQETFQAAGATDADAEGLINYLKSIAGVEVALVFREISSDNIKISLRSKSWFDVNQLAAIFGGGGHPRAAGCLKKGKLKDVVQQFIETAVEKIAQGGAS